jgi:Na+/H+-dicarboxylate symporter
VSLPAKILIGLGAGTLVGFVANLARLRWLTDALAVLEPLGTAFIRLITMIVIPLVVASLIVGAASLGDVRRLGRLGLKTLGYYLATTALAVTIGLAVANLVQPGRRIDPATRDRLAAQAQLDAAPAEPVTPPSIKDLLLGIIPRNPLKAAADFDLLPLIFFTVMFGAAVSVLAEPRRRVILTFFEGVNDASITIIGWVMQLAPYAVFVLLAAVVARFGLDLLRSLLVYALAVVLGLALHAFGSIALIVRFLARLDPLEFYRRIAAAPLVAFSTSSSSATLPVTLETAERRLGVPKPVASFVLPLGATINMDGTALYQAVAVMFIAQIYGVTLDLGAQLTIVLTATLASIGAAGVPSAGLITLIVVLNAVGLGEQVGPGIALILGVDRILDMLRTSVNVTGDLACAAFIARTEGATLTPAAAPGKT